MRNFNFVEIHFNISSWGTEINLRFAILSPYICDPFFKKENIVMKIVGRMAELESQDL